MQITQPQSHARNKRLYNEPRLTVMPGCSLSPNHVIANMWMKLMKMIRSPAHDETTKKARFDIKTALQNIDISQSELRADILSIAGEVKRSQSAHVNTAITSLLVQSRSKRQRLAVLEKHRMNLQSQFDALESLELNEKVMSSVRQTSSVLKSMGLDAKLEQIDETMDDLTESSYTISSITDALGQNIGSASNFDDSSLESELEILLSDNADPTSTKVFLTPPPAAKKTTESISDLPRPMNTLQESTEENDTEATTVQLVNA